MIVRSTLHHRSMLWSARGTTRGRERCNRNAISCIPVLTQSVESWDWTALVHCACKSGTYMRLRTAHVGSGLTCVVRK